MNARKINRRFKEFFRRNKELWSMKVVKNFNLGFKPNMGILLHGTHKQCWRVVSSIGNKEMLRSIEEVCNYVLRKAPKIDVDRLAALTRMRNIMLGTFMRSHQDICECPNRKKNHYFNSCKMTKEFRRILKCNTWRDTAKKLW